MGDREAGCEARMSSGRVSIGFCHSYQCLQCSCMHQQYHQAARRAQHPSTDRTDISTDEDVHVEGWNSRVVKQFATEKSASPRLSTKWTRIVFVTSPSTTAITTDHHVVKRAHAAVSLSDAPCAPRSHADPQYAATPNSAREGQRAASGGATSSSRHCSAARM